VSDLFGSKLKVWLDGAALDVETLNEASAFAASQQGHTITLPWPAYSANYTLRIKRLYKGNSAPTANFMYATEAFGLIVHKQCEEDLNYYKSKLYEKHLKRQRKSQQTTYKWKRERSNHVGK
jgi:hypothetical protein